MANNGREYKRERPFGQEADKPGNSDESKYGDHPILGNDKQSLANEFLRPPSRSGADPVTFSARSARSRCGLPAPNPMTVVPPANALVKLLGTVVALLLFALVVWFLFHNWMTPGPRHPGEQKQGQELQQK